MEPKIVKANAVKDVLTPERCTVAENWGYSTGDPTVSIARATVKPGVTTKKHHLEGVQEIYLIAKGKGKVHIGDLEPAEVFEGDVVAIPAGVTQSITNIGDADLVFHCICTPSFTQNCYHNDEPEP
ncbi:MAG: cupin domain-containing protein [Candidatus Bathyarchaeota archaeon]|nr:cupin domain-containing protein [Candidatus Bathyarchaeota archaeon]